MFETNKVYVGDAKEILQTFPANCVDTIVTSPPYYGQRDYGNGRQVGNEPSPNGYVARLAEIFDECRRVLKTVGTLWLNLGDKYLNENLLGIPWKVAFALQEKGWILRSDIIWHKPNAAPSSVKNRPTVDHEYLFLFSKTRREYYYDADAIREPHITFTPLSKMRGGRNHFGIKGGTPEQGKYGGSANLHKGRWDLAFHPKGRNKRTVWSVPLSKFPGKHFAVFPEKLITPCILAGSPVGGIVLDPFLGSGTTAIVAVKLQRHYLGIDINKTYCTMARQRLAAIEKTLVTKLTEYAT